MVLTRKLAALAAVLAVAPAAAPADDPPAQLEPAVRRGASSPTLSIWDGIYTDEQARRGEYLYPGPCGKCHGVKLDGAPEDPDMFSTKPIAGPKFLRDWDGRTLGVLYEYLRATMPANNPGFLSDREYADLIAFMLARSGAPSGRTELEPDPSRLAALLIRKAAER